jgi:flagellar biosynthesis protein FlhF
MSSSEKPRNYVKSFFAPSFQAAMERAGREMGPDALLLDSREAPPEARHLGAYEVVFGVAQPEPNAAAEPPAADPGETSGTTSAVANAPLPEFRPAPSVPSERMAGLPEAEIRRLKEVYRALRRLKEVYSLLNRPLAEAVPGDPEPDNEVSQWLVDAGMESALAGEIEAAARRRITPAPASRAGMPHLVPEPASRVLWRKAEEELASRFSVAPQLGRVTALVGPPGSGKTTTLVKLAMKHGLAAGRPVRLISTDTRRIGATEQLRSYATEFRMPFQAADGIAALAQAIGAAPDNALVLIDTPGSSARMLQDGGSGLAAYLSRRQEIDTHLVLTASMRLIDLYRAAALYSSFRPSKWIFTRLDETSSMASVFCAAARRNLPVSFLAAGQSVPDDLAPADKAAIVRSMVRQLPFTLAAVA